MKKRYRALALLRSEEVGYVEKGEIIELSDDRARILLRGGWIEPEKKEKEKEPELPKTIEQVFGKKMAEVMRKAGFPEWVNLINATDAQLETIPGVSDTKELRKKFVKE